MSSTYNPQSIEEEIQKKWDQEKRYESKIDGRKKYYCLSMFPYPSGKLHMGHVRNYVIGDCLARFKRMKGFNVLYPMGFDSFGLPAEQYAIEHNIHPAVITEENINSIRSQLQFLCEPLKRAAEQQVHRVLRAVQLRGDLTSRQALNLHPQDHVAVVFGQPAHGLLK